VAREGCGLRGRCQVGRGANSQFKRCCGACMHASLRSMHASLACMAEASMALWERLLPSDRLCLTGTPLRLQRMSGGVHDDHKAKLLLAKQLAEHNA
jgi:hypothetical protein